MQTGTHALPRKKDACCTSYLFSTLFHFFFTPEENWGVWHSHALFSAPFHFLVKRWGIRAQYPSAKDGARCCFAPSETYRTLGLMHLLWSHPLSTTSFLWCIALQGWDHRRCTGPILRRRVLGADAVSLRNEMVRRTKDGTKAVRRCTGTTFEKQANLI